MAFEKVYKTEAERVAANKAARARAERKRKDKVKAIKAGAYEKAKKMPKYINAEQFENMCSILCTQQEICHILRLEYEEVDEWCKHTYGCNFPKAHAMISDGGRMSLRRKQFKKAVEDEDTRMLIWMGKQFLGQSERVESKHMAEGVTLNFSPEVFKPIVDIEEIQDDKIDTEVREEESGEESD